MPVFEFRCGSCQATSEELLLAGDVAAAPVCPSCGSHEMNRLLSTFAAPTSGAPAGSEGFDADAACGGGACRMPDYCGAKTDDFE